MPVYWFALSQTSDIDSTNAVIVFIILHLLLYPASNGYNSYMDRDTGSIGGIKNPKQPTIQLFYVSILLDIAAIILASFISVIFTVGIICYILSSRAYSYRGIRLKKYPIIGYFTVIIFQGAVTYFLVIHGSSHQHPVAIPVTGVVAASFLIGGFYPLTQIYQHKQDKEDGVISMSMLLGLNGTFIFTAIIYSLAVGALAVQLITVQQQENFFIMQIFFLPVLFYFFWWWAQVKKNRTAANFKNTMRMNLLASICTNAAFFVLFLIEKR